MTLDDFIAERTEMLNRFKRYAEPLDYPQYSKDEDMNMARDEWMRELEYFLENTEE